MRALLAEERPELVEGSMDTRSRILASASKVFAERGYEEATLDEVAADAGLTKGAVYWHLASKSDLFAIDMACGPRASDPDQLVPEMAGILWRGIGRKASTPDD